MEAESKSVASEKMWLSDFRESPWWWHLNPAPLLPHPGASVREGPHFVWDVMSEVTQVVTLGPTT